MNNSKMSARMCAFKILCKIETEGAFSNIALKEGLASSSLEGADRRLVSTIVYGCVKYKRYLDYIISQFSNVKIKKLSANVVLILRMGVYQIIKLDRVPDSAAVNESVKLAQKEAFRTKGLVNAVLRKVCAQKNNINMPGDLTQRSIIEFSFPDELANMWIDEYGADKAYELMRLSNEPTIMTARVNTLKTDEQTIIQRLCSEGVNAQSLGIKNMIAVSDIANIDMLDSYKEGLFTPQGIGSYLASLVLSPKSGDVVIDMCAAPGGKSTHIAEIMKNVGTIHSFDIYPHRISLIENGAKRLGIDIIKTNVADSSKCMEKYVDSADCVLADVVCSGLGIIHKKPDIKWSFDKDKLDLLVRLQYEILSVASRYVKKGGSLVYSTCTISKAENLGVIERFLKEHSDFCTYAFDDILPTKYTNDTAKDGYVQFYPDKDGLDGFFICKLRRKN